MYKNPRGQLKTKFANSGRIAGSGILYDRYDDEAVLERQTQYSRPVPIAEREERAKREHEEYPVITYFLDKEEL